jgi:hypothetical protein
MITQLQDRSAHRVQYHTQPRLGSAVITREQARSLLFDACPSFLDSEHWRMYEEDWANDPEQPLHLFASAFVRHLAELNASGRRGEFPGIFAILDRMHVEGDVQELARSAFWRTCRTQTCIRRVVAPLTSLLFYRPCRDGGGTRSNYSGREEFRTSEVRAEPSRERLKNLKPEPRPAERTPPRRPTTHWDTVGRDCAVVTDYPLFQRRFSPAPPLQEIDYDGC